MKTWSGHTPPIRRAAALLAACMLCAALIQALPVTARAASALPPRFIAIVYDDSGSMREGTGGKQINNYIYANYSLQNLAAMMEQRDSAKVYLFTKKGRNPVAVRRQKDLYSAMKNIGAKPEGNTYAETVKAAMADGAAFLKNNPNGQLLFVMVTDGDSMYDAKGTEIKGSLQGIFSGYLKASRMAAYANRCRALLLSIGSAKPLSPVSDLRSVLEESGITTTVFSADITKDSVAGGNIMESMTDLAEALASTNMMSIEPGKPFTIRYPLESLVVMEQFQQASESTVRSIEGDSGALTRSTLYTTRAIGGVKLASTFSSVKAGSGSIKPGSYTINASGKTRLMVFAKVGFTTAVSITDSNGKEVAAYTDGRWSRSGLELAVGVRLSARVTFRALDGSPVAVDSHVKISYGKNEAIACNSVGQGAFGIEAVKAGREYLTVTLDDPEFFQITLPALSVTVPEPATSSPQPGSSATAGPSAEPTAHPDEPALNSDDLLNLANRVYPVPYTSAAEYTRAVSIPVGGVLLRQAAISFEDLPDGLQLRFNGKVFERGRLEGHVQVAEQNTLELWVNHRFAVAGEFPLTIHVGDSQRLKVRVQPIPRKLKVEATPARLELDVLGQSGGRAPAAYRVLIEQGGTWVELPGVEVLETSLVSPSGLPVRLESDAGRLVVTRPWLPALMPVGKSEVFLTVGTGKPGETAQAAIVVFVRDDWRKWLAPGAVLAALLLVGAYALALALKRRIPMGMEVRAGSQPDMSDSVPVALSRRMLRRNLWPFGREVCTVGPFEIYPHRKRRDRVVLSSMAVQYGLLLDGKPPHHHKERDEAGDFVLSGDTVAAVRENGQYRYYRFLCYCNKTEKATQRKKGNK